MQGSDVPVGTGATGVGTAGRRAAVGVVDGDGDDLIDSIVSPGPKTLELTELTEDIVAWKL